MDRETDTCKASSTRSTSQSARSKACSGCGCRGGTFGGLPKQLAPQRHVPGIIDGIIASAPLFSRVVVVGVCMGSDHIRPAMAINKEINLRFVLGYTPLEFRDTLHMLADGKVNAAPLITGTVGLPGVAAAFDALGDPEAHAKIMIDPKSNAASPQPFRVE